MSKRILVVEDQPDNRQINMSAFGGKADIERGYPAILPQFCAKCSAPRSETAKMV